MSQTQTSQNSVQDEKSERVSGNAPDIIILLDESGSMESMGKEPVQGVNAFITEQKKVGGDSNISLYTFNTKTRTIYEKVKLDVAEPLVSYAYKPEGMTSLYDCIITAVNANKSTRNTVLVILTDGEDTSSIARKDDAVKLLEAQEKNNNWQIVYLGVGKDAFNAGANISRHRTFVDPSQGGIMESMGNASYSVSAYRSASRVQQNTKLNLTNTVLKPSQK